MMTAPLRVRTARTVNVALGDRAYDIVIGRGVAASLGARIAALKPGARLAIVTDENVARAHLDAIEAQLAAAGMTRLAHRGSARRGIEELRLVRARLRCADRRQDRAQRPHRRVRRRRGRRSRRLRGGERAARPRFRAGADHAAGAGRFVRRRQDRDQFAPRQEPRRRVPPADPGARRHRAARHACRSATSAPAMPRSRSSACSAMPASSPGSRRTGRTPSRADPAREHAIAIACRGKAAIVARDERETGERALLNLGHTFGHAFEAAAGFSDRLLHGEAISLGIACAFEFSASLGLLSPNDAGRVAAPPRRRRPADQHPRRARACRPMPTR